MSLHRRNPKRDANEKAIRKALEACGCDVTPISGKGAPDLLVRRAGSLWALEVKSETGTRTEAQEESRWPIVRSALEAVQLVNGTPRGPYRRR